MSLAAETRDAVRRHPFLLDGLGAGVVNFTAAARYLDVEGDEEAVATALRRFAEDLPGPEPATREARVTMESGLGETDAADALLSVGGARLAPGEGSLTGVLARGEVDPPALASALRRLDATNVDVRAAGVAGGSVLVVVERRDGPTAIRVVEDVLGT